MILQSLRLQNFRSFASASVNFTEQQNYIFGGNWQGKSSLVEGVAFALFGSDAFPRKIAGASLKAEHLVTDGATSGEVELVFRLGDHEYGLRRSLPQSSVSLSKDGTRIANGKKPVEEKIQDLLAVDAKFFSNVFYADQDDLRKSFDLSPADRRLFIERLIGQEIWRERIEGLRQAEKHLHGFIEDLASGRFGAFVDEMDALSNEIGEGEQELADLKRELAELRRALPKSRRDLRKAEETESERLEKAEGQRSILEGNRDDLDALIRGISKGKCPTCTQTVPPPLRRTRLAALRARLRQLTTELRRVSKEIDAATEAFEEADYDDANERLDEAQGLEERIKVLDQEQRKRIAREKHLRTQ